MSSFNPATNPATKNNIKGTTPVNPSSFYGKPPAADTQEEAVAIRSRNPDGTPVKDSAAEESAAKIPSHHGM